MGQVQKLTNFVLDLDIAALVSTDPQLQGGEEKLKQLKKYLKPKIFWRELTINSLEANRIVFDQGQFIINSAYVASGLKGCQKSTLFAATIDKDLPNYAQKCLETGSLYEAILADNLGSHGVEMIAEKFHQFLKARYLPQGLFSSLRFSPGYGDWLLEEQEKIINYLQVGGLIEVTTNYLLKPVKSITALVGWSTKPQSSAYPQGDKKKGFCHGSKSCEFCITWACRK